MTYLVAEIVDPYGIAENVTNDHVDLRFGSYVTANILGAELSQATSIPRYLVNNSRVAILNEESKLEFVAIDIARQDGAEVIISGGLSNGDRVITSALDYPVDGMQLALPGDKAKDDEVEESKETDTQIASVES